MIGNVGSMLALAAMQGKPQAGGASLPGVANLMTNVGPILALAAMQMMRDKQRAGGANLPGVASRSNVGVSRGLYG